MLEAGEVFAGWSRQWRAHNARCEAAIHDLIESRHACGCRRRDMAKVIPFPEYESLTVMVPPEVLAEVRRVCFHDRKRIAAFIAAALEERLHELTPDPARWNR